MKKKIDVSSIAAAAQSGNLFTIRPNKGGDPELFLRKAGILVPACDQYGQSKYGLYANADVAGVGEYTNETATVNDDGYQAELRYSPHTCREIIIMRIRSALNRIRRDGYDAVIEPVVRLPDGYLASAPKRVTESGCNPDFDAYRDGEPNEPIQGFDKLQMRFAGGHIMLSVETGSMYSKVRTQHDVLRLVKLMDRIVGIPSVIMANGAAEKYRRMFYGRPGCYRWSMGRYVEYRSLSNFWLKSPTYTWVVYGLAEMAATAFCNGWDSLYDISDADVHDIMLHCDVDRAKYELARMVRSFSLMSTAWNSCFSTLPSTSRRAGNSYVNTMYTILGHRPMASLWDEWHMDSEDKVTGVHGYRLASEEFAAGVRANRARYMRMLG